MNAVAKSNAMSNAMSNANSNANSNAKSNAMPVTNDGDDGGPGDDLPPIVLGLGAADGYSGADLTSPRTAVLAGEVPYLALDGSTPRADPVLVLRIHGIGGAPSTDNLQVPNTVQVAGDDTAGFYRAWYPGGSAVGQPRREAYCWGGLNTRASSRALWLLLVSFMLVNVAHWALPGRWEERTQPKNAIPRSVLRLIALALTVAFVTTAATVVADLVAWQAADRGALPSWLNWYAGLYLGTRLALALLVVLGVVAGLTWLSWRSARDYEQWQGATRPDTEKDWALSHPSFWNGDQVVRRQRNCHAVAASAVVMLFAALPHASHDVIRRILIGAALALLVFAAVLIATPWADRISINEADAGGDAKLTRLFAGAAVALAAGTCVSRIWWRIEQAPSALPGDQLLQTSVVFAQFGLLALLLIAVAAHKPWTLKGDVMGRGLVAPLLTLLACVIGSIFSASLTLAVANVLGTPKVTVAGDSTGAQTLLLPSTVYAGGLGMLAAVACGVLVLGWALLQIRATRKRLADPASPDAVVRAYPDVPEKHGQSASAVARTWAVAALTDRAAFALALLALPTAAVFVTHLALLQGGVHAEWLGGLTRAAALGGTIGVAATVFFIAQLRSALLNSSARRRFGALWDIGTFWPRACHPFAPPCYAERTIPEVATRIRRIVGTADSRTEAAARPATSPPPTGLEEAHSPVLLTGYSQGTPISVAVTAQLSQDVRAKMSLLLLAAPVRRLYGRAFPQYFGPDALTTLATRLEGTRLDGRPGSGGRWRTLVRRSDYVGGAAFGPSAAAGVEVDRPILDPPALWPDGDPGHAPTHMHSDLFSDPQIRPFEVELSGVLELGLHADGGAGDAHGLEQRLAAGGAHELGASDGEQHNDESKDHVQHDSEIPHMPQGQT